MSVPPFVYGLLLLIEALGPLEIPMNVDIVRSGAVDDRLLLEAEQTVYRVRDLETDARRLDIERSRLYGHVFFVFMAPLEESPGDGEEGEQPGIAAIDFSDVFLALASRQPSQEEELIIETSVAGSWSILLRGDSIILATTEAPLFLHARPAVPLLQ